MKSASLWLLENILKDAIISILEPKELEEGSFLESFFGSKSAENTMSDILRTEDEDLEQISHDATVKLIRELGLHITEDHLKELEVQVRSAISEINNIIIETFVTEFRSRRVQYGNRVEEAYQSMLSDTSWLTQNTLPIAEHLSSNISAIKAIKSKLEKAPVKAAITKLHKDKQPDKQSAFEYTGNKTSGLSAGYRAVRQAETFMLKVAALVPDFNKQRYDTRNERRDSISFFNEFVMSPLYERMLYKRTPIIAGVEADAQGEVLLRSKFLKSFSTASQYTGGKESHLFGRSSLKDVSGAGKLMSALLAGGEQDMHAGNIGVMWEWDGRVGENKRVFSKIDHGWSATMLFTNGESMWQSFNKACDTYEYKDNVDIDITEFRESLDQILMITPDEIEGYLKARIYELRKMGFDPTGLQFRLWTDDIHRDYIAYPASLFEYDEKAEGDFMAQLEKHYIERFRQHWEALSQYRDLVVAAEKITKPLQPGDDPEKPGEKPESGWVEGQWIKSIKGQNPILYALDNRLIIDGVDPMEYAVSHGIKISGMSPIEYGVKHNILKDHIDNMVVLAIKTDNETVKDFVDHYVQLTNKPAFFNNLSGDPAGEKLFKDLCKELQIENGKRGQDRSQVRILNLQAIKKDFIDLGEFRTLDVARAK